MSKKRSRFVLSLILLAATAALLALGGLTAPKAARADTCTPGGDWPAHNPSLANQVLQLLNQHRASLNPPAPPLALSQSLQRAAEWKARHLAHYFDFDKPGGQQYNGGPLQHDDPAPPENQTWVERIHACGYPSNTGKAENLALGQTTAQQVVSTWLNSPGHRANIENSSYRAIGIGVAAAQSGYAWAQDFGTLVEQAPSSIQLFEGWNVIASWQGPSLSGVSAVIGGLNARVSPNTWRSVAEYQGGAWLQTFRTAPFPSLNTLTSVLPGRSYWLHAGGSSSLAFNP